MNAINTPAATATVFSSFFATKEEYLSFKAQWKALANKKALTAVDAALRILVLNQDALRSMPPTKNPVRIANGALNESGLQLAMNDLRWEIHLAKTVLKKRAAGDAPSLSPFAQRWVGHGLTIDDLVELFERSSATNLNGGV